MTNRMIDEQQIPRGWCAIRWLRFALAVTFLTRLPLPVRGEVRPEDQRASLAWYPLIGAGLGAAGYGVYLVGAGVLPPLPAAALAIILLELFTGVLHLDGFMDTCDGVGSGKPRERMLEIMKDSRVGAMGVFGAVAVLLLKVTLLAALAPWQALLPLLGGWAMARAVAVLDVALFRYARASGTGGLFAGGVRWWTPAVALATAALVGWACGGPVGLVMLALAGVVTLSAQAMIARTLGGLTGDVYGFGIELAEVLALIGGVVVTAL